MIEKKKNRSGHVGVGTQLHPNFLQQKSAASYHWGMGPLYRSLIKINSVEVFFSAIHNV